MRESAPANVARPSVMSGDDRDSLAYLLPRMHQKGETPARKGRRKHSHIFDLQSHLNVSSAFPSQRRDSAASKPVSLPQTKVSIFPGLKSFREPGRGKGPRGRGVPGTSRESRPFPGKSGILCDFLRIPFPGTNLTSYPTLSYFMFTHFTFTLTCHFSQFLSLW